MRKKSNCGQCKVEFEYDNTQQSGRWCSNQCQMDNRYDLFITKWKEGSLDKKSSYGISKHIRRYLFKLHNDKCSMCGWGKKNLTTGRIPLEIHHIDGNPFNHSENNLRLLCPNCHSLTPTYGVLNKGNGRYIRTGTLHPSKRSISSTG